MRTARLAGKPVGIFLLLAIASLFCGEAAAGEQYTITYVLNGGTNAAGNPAGYNAETEPIPLKKPTKAGFAFTGWFESPDFTTARILSSFWISPYEVTQEEFEDVLLGNSNGIRTNMFRGKYMNPVAPWKGGGANPSYYHERSVLQSFEY